MTYKQTGKILSLENDDPIVANKRGKSYPLEEIAFQIWKKCGENKNLQEITVEIANEQNIHPNELSEAVQYFISELIENELIQPQ